MPPALPITVYFDGYCPVCRREVANYRRQAPQAAIVWRDLAGTDDVLADEDFDLAAALTLLHVRDGDGRLWRGLDAHLCLWAALPGWRLLVAPIRRLGWLRRALEATYRLFTRHRPGLRRRQREQVHG